MLYARVDLVRQVEKTGPNGIGRVNDLHRDQTETFPPPIRSCQLNSNALRSRSALLTDVGRPSRLLGGLVLGICIVFRGLIGSIEMLGIF